jgi:ABC-type glycerol-3-phosphate transport system substrate-binding protein
MPSFSRPTWFRALAAGAALALVGAGCGGGGKSSASTTTVPVATTTPPPGQLQLSMIVVQPADLPSGWTPKPADAPPKPEAEPIAFAQCMGSPTTAGDVVAVAYSPDYVKGTEVITSSATSFKTRNDVPTDSAALTNPKAATCLEQVNRARLDAELPSGGVVKSYKVTITPGTGGGPTNAVATATSTITFTDNGHSLTLTEIGYLLVAPRIETWVDFDSVNQAIATTVKSAVLDAVAGRVAYGS